MQNQKKKTKKKKKGLLSKFFGIDKVANRTEMLNNTLRFEDPHYDAKKAIKRMKKK